LAGLKVAKGDVRSDNGPGGGIGNLFVHGTVQRPGRQGLLTGYPFGRTLLL
jgi:hypothetical protein